VISSGGGFCFVSSASKPRSVVRAPLKPRLAFPEFAGTDRPVHESPQSADSPAAFLESWRGFGPALSFSQNPCYLRARMIERSATPITISAIPRASINDGISSCTDVPSRL
jgi:hypothetical protein